MNDSKKRILIINSHFGIGGIETAMVNMANALCEEYDVDLFVFYPEGPMKERLDPRVNILKSNFALKALVISAKEAIKEKNPFVFIFNRLGAIWSHIFDNRLPIYLALKTFHKLGNYDLAISYRQENQKKELASGYVRFLDRCVIASKRVAWVHFDATAFPEMQNFNRKYYQKADKIIGVSAAVSTAFEKMNSQLACKMDYCYNIINYKEIYQKSLEEQKESYPKDKFICFSACRLSKGKGIERTISAIETVMKEQNDILWYIAGDGPQRQSILNIIKEKNLQDQIILLGQLNNPYPYIKNADLFLLTSYHEAAPVVYMEAKALKTPVFTTRTLSSEEMLGNMAFICENSEEGIHNAFDGLMKNRERISTVRNILNNNSVNNDVAFEKLKGFIDGIY